MSALSRVVLTAARLPFSLRLLRSTRKEFNSYLLNRLGVQVFRTSLHYALWSCRRRRVSAQADPYLRQLEDHGIVCIPDFLSPANFNKVREEFESGFSGGSNSKNHLMMKAGPILLDEVRVYSGTDNAHPTIRECIMNAPLLHEIVCAAARRKPRVPPTCYLQRASRLEIGRQGKMSVYSEIEDTDNTLHQDHFIPVFKAWLYIEDVNERNGAIVYTPPSHRFSLARLRHEYERSCYVSLLLAGKKDRVPPEMVEHNRVIPSARTRQRMGFCEESQCAPANTLVIANTRGFHKRGSFEPGQTRKTVRIDFRRLESLPNKVPFLHRVIDFEAAARAILHH